MSSTSTTVSEVATLHLAPQSPSHYEPPSSSVSGRERATSRFAAAQQVFSRQPATQTTSRTPTFLNRQRTNTLYSRLDSSVIDGAFQSGQPSTDSDSNEHSFTSAFMKKNPRAMQKALPAARVASSESPPTPVNEGCILLGPRRTLSSLDVTKQIQASTTNGSPAWYCRHDKLVIFDRVESDEHGTPRLVNRSSRGLDVARRNCPKTTIQVAVPCVHCQDLLQRKTWVFEERMLECRVCKACQDRSWLEWEKQKKPSIDITTSTNELLPEAQFQDGEENHLEASGDIDATIEVAESRTTKARDSVMSITVDQEHSDG